MPQRFLILDGLRFAFALIVVSLHACSYPGKGYLAVDFFFVLSGFVPRGIWMAAILIPLSALLAIPTYYWFELPAKSALRQFLRIK